MVSTSTQSIQSIQFVLPFHTPVKPSLNKSLKMRLLLLYVIIIIININVSCSEEVVSVLKSSRRDSKNSEEEIHSLSKDENLNNDVAVVWNGKTSQDLHREYGT